MVISKNIKKFLSTFPMLSFSRLTLIILDVPIVRSIIPVLSLFYLYTFLILSFITLQRIKVKKSRNLEPNKLEFINSKRNLKW